MSFPPALENLMNANWKTFMSRPIRKDEDAYLVKKLNKLLGRTGLGVEFDGSMLAHDEPYSHWIRFTPDLTDEEILKVEAFAKKYFKKRYYEVYGRPSCFLKYGFMSAKSFDSIADAIGMDILITDAETACEELNDWMLYKEDENVEDMSKHVGSIQFLLKMLREDQKKMEES